MPRNKTLISVFAVAGLVAGWAIAPNQYMQLITPPTVVILLIGLVRPLYGYLRRASYESGQGQEEFRSALAPDESAQKPEFFPGVAPIHRAQGEAIRASVEAQGKYFSAGIMSSILPSLALLLLALQLLVFPFGGAWAVGLILAEITCVGYLLMFVWTKNEPTELWISNRLRAELLRREQYLVVANVGPYLGKDDTESELIAIQRASTIRGAPSVRLHDLAALQDNRQDSWIEAALTSGDMLPIPGDLAARIQTYLEHRIGKQLLWFSSK